MKHSPLTQSERIVLIDALRGFALLGILMVNVHLMYEPMYSMMAGADPDASVKHIVAESFVKFFFEGKFYVIFSMLFGFGFFMFLNKSKDTGDSALPVFKRRLFYLLLIGLAHIGLLWAGDILVFYALFGFLLILYRKATDKKIIRWAVILTVIPTFLMALMVLVIDLFSQIPEAKAEMDAQFQGSMLAINELLNRASLVYSTGSFSEMVSVRFEEYFSLLVGGLFFFCPVVLAMFLTGYLAGRKGIIANYTSHLPLFRKMFWWGMAIGAVTSALYTIAYRHAITNVPDGWSLLASSMHFAGGISLGLCYISGIVILFSKGRAAWLARNFAPIGRMALTNYLLQSLIGALLFHSYGLGLFGKVEMWQGIVMAMVIFTLQVMFSRWWLSRYRFGPFEWLWRSLTYFQMQPIRKKVSI